MSRHIACYDDAKLHAEIHNQILPLSVPLLTDHKRQETAQKTTEHAIGRRDGELSFCSCAEIQYKSVAA